MLQLRYDSEREEVLKVFWITMQKIETGRDKRVVYDLVKREGGIKVGYRTT